MIQSPPASGARQRGFTLIEVTVSLTVTIIVLLGVLALFDFSNKLSRVQTNISDMQQSLRVAQNDAVRLIRMAGIGDLPQGNLPDGTAVAVQNNVADGTHVGPADSPEVFPNSDVLTVRGIFSSPIYQIDKDDATALVLSPAAGAPTTGKIHVKSTTTETHFPQDLSALKEAIDKQRPEALLLVSPINPGPWAVVELDPGNSDISNPADIVVAFKMTGGNTTDYLKFSSSPGTYPTDLTTVISVGLLEEYRFYVRREYAISGDKSSALTPKLSRARVYPGTQKPWDDSAENWHADIADNIFDFQVALGLDTNAKDPASGACAEGTVASDEINCDVYESADGENDDWMYNGEKNTDPALFLNSRLYYVRISTLARTDRRDHDYEAPALTRVEDNSYDGSPFNTTNERMYRRRLLRTVIDMRNL